VGYSPSWLQVDEEGYVVCLTDEEFEEEEFEEEDSKTALPDEMQEVEKHAGKKQRVAMDVLKSKFMRKRKNPLGLDIEVHAPGEGLSENEKALIFAACAKAAHEVNRAYCQAIGDMSQIYPWESAPQWQVDSAILGVQGVLLDDNSPEESHASWLAQKEEAGWVYGEVKDPKKKEHPCMVPYKKLPPEQRAKDRLFVNVVRMMAKSLGWRGSNLSLTILDGTEEPAFGGSGEDELLDEGEQ